MQRKGTTLLALAAAAVTLSVLWYLNRPIIAKEATWEVEEISRSREAYQSEAYKASGLPAAPAVMVEDEITGQGAGLSEERLEAVIRRHLGLSPLKSQN